MRDAQKRGNSSEFMATNSPAARLGRSVKQAARKALGANFVGREGGLFDLEMLETRRLMTGTWSLINTAVPSGDGGQGAVVLSNGGLMVHGGSDSASNKYYKLTPTNGSYINGTWTTLAAAPTYRLFDATNVLPSGKVMVLGGEYSGTTTTETLTNTGEIYDPVANTWSVMANYPQADFGDDPTEMLPNGNVLAGYIFSGATYMYNPTTNAWSATGTKLRSDRSDEEGWVKLADDSILSYDVFASASANVPHAQRYIPSSNTWVDAGTPTALLSSANVGYELGPGMALPDGRVLFVGGTNASSYYNPSSNSWTAGPTFSIGGTAYVAADAAGAVLPNGDVLLALSPLGALSSGSYTFPSPTHVVELNPTTNAYTDVAPSLSGFSTGNASFIYTFCVLPTGQVAMFGASGRIAVYTESGSPLAASAPSITNITNDAGTNTFTLTGFQLNGNSEGAAYGDDNEMASDYPLVELTDQSGNITFARTFNWTLDGIANVASSVSFVEPTVGTYVVNVIANGIASLPVLSVPAGAGGNESFAVQPDANSAYVDVRIGENGTIYSTFALSSFNSLIMTGDAAANTLVVNANLGGKATTINGGNGSNDLDVENNGTGNVTEYGASSAGGTDYFDFSEYGQNLSNIANFTYVYGGVGNEQVRAYDNTLATATTYSVNSADVTRTGWSGFYYAVAVNGISVVTGRGGDIVNVASTYPNTPLALNSASGSDTVNIGTGGSVQSIFAPITISNTPAFTTVNIDDSADTIGRTAQIGVSGATSTLSGLAPSAINWTVSDVSSVNILGGSGGNSFAITSQTAVKLTAGSGTDLINVNSTLSYEPVSISSSTGNDVVNVGTAGLGSAVANFINSQQIGVLTIGTGGTARVSSLSPRILLQATSVVASGTGVLDLTTNDLLLHGSSLAAASALVQTGFNAGGLAWQGAGITSSTAASDTNQLTALGAILNSYDGGTHVLYPAIDGVAASASDILVKYTYFGDANDSGVVDASDYSLADSTFIAEKTAGNISGWYNGDFNYDGVVNGSDYTLIDNAFNRQGASLAAELSDAVAAPASKITTVSTLPALNSSTTTTTAASWQDLQKKNKWITQFFD